MIYSKLLANISGIHHGFGDAKNPIPHEFNFFWNNRPSNKQTHGTRAIEISTFRQICGDGDALITSIKSIPIPIATADCVPILLARKDGCKIASIHAGWRGTKARISSSLWNKLLSQGETPSNWVAAIGPAIGPCCYSVDPQLFSAFRNDFKIKTDPACRLDLPLINKTELEMIGIQQIELIRCCTYCTYSDIKNNNPTFNSFRRDKTKNRQFTAIMKA